MNSDNDMSHVKGSVELQRQLAAGQAPHGIFGDAADGKSFSDEEAKILETRSRQVREVGAGWQEVWAGPGSTLWTVIDCRPNTREEIAEYLQAIRSAAGGQVVYEYTAGGETVRETAFSKRSEARAAINEAHNPVLVRISAEDHQWFDAYPQGHPIPPAVTVRLAGREVQASVEVEERCVLTPSGMRWRAV